MRRGGGGENSVWLACEHIYAFCLFKNSGHSRRSVSNLAWNNTISERRRVLYSSPCSSLLWPQTPYPNLDPPAKMTMTVPDDSCGAAADIHRSVLFLCLYIHYLLYVYRGFCDNNTIIWDFFPAVCFEPREHRKNQMRVDVKKFLNSKERQNVILNSWKKMSCTMQVIFKLVVIIFYIFEIMYLLVQFIYTSVRYRNLILDLCVDL